MKLIIAFSILIPFVMFAGFSTFPNGGGKLVAGTNYTSININAVYTNLTGNSGLLVGYVAQLSTSSSRISVLLNYTNNGVGYVLDLEPPNTTANVNSSIPFSVPIAAGGTFIFAPSINGAVQIISATLWNGI